MSEIKESHDWGNLSLWGKTCVLISLGLVTLYFAISGVVSDKQRVKSALALISAYSIGLWTGINYVAKLVDPKLAFGKPPAWVGHAEQMAIASIVLLALCVLGWIVTDYRELQQ